MKNFVKYSGSKERITLIRKKLKQEWTLTSIAKELDISLGALSHYCTRHKIDHNRDLRIDYDDVKIKKLIKKKIPLTSISEKLNISYYRLYAHCKKRNFDFISKGRMRGLYDYSEVLILVNKGMTILDISEKLKIPYHSVYDYCAYHKIKVKRIKYRHRNLE